MELFFDFIRILRESSIRTRRKIRIKSTGVRTPNIERYLTRNWLHRHSCCDLIKSRQVLSNDKNSVRVFRAGENETSEDPLRGGRTCISVRLEQRLVAVLEKHLSRENTVSQSGVLLTSRRNAARMAK